MHYHQIVFIVKKIAMRIGLRSKYINPQPITITITRTTTTTRTTTKRTTTRRTRKFPRDRRKFESLLFQDLEIRRKHLGRVCFIGLFHLSALHRSPKSDNFRLPWLRRKRSLSSSTIGLSIPWAAILQKLFCQCSQCDEARTTEVRVEQQSFLYNDKYSQRLWWRIRKCRVSDSCFQHASPLKLIWAPTSLPGVLLILNERLISYRRCIVN